MTGSCKLNNKSMRNIRREAVYQCVMIDLSMLGVISKEECEMLIGGGIPKNLMLPNGKNNTVAEAEVTEVPFVETTDDIPGQIELDFEDTDSTMDGADVDFAQSEDTNTQE